MWLTTLVVFCFAFFVTAIIWDAVRKSLQRQKGKIPGLKPSHPIEGNNGDIKIKYNNNLGLFLWDLHKKYGPIASFWKGKQYAVSVAAPEFLKPQRQLSNTIPGVFDQFRVLVGDDCFPFLDIEEVRKRRKVYDHHFMLKACKSYTECFSEIAQEFIEKWSKLSPDDQIPLLETTSDATLKGILRTNYGNYFKDEKSFTHFKKLFAGVNKGIDANYSPNSPEYKKMEEDAEKIQDIVKKIIENRRKEKEDSDRDLFIDCLLDNDIPDSQRMADSIVMINAGADSTGKILMWIIHDLATNPDVQEKLYEELKTVLDDNPATLENIPKLIYLRQVIDETLRFRSKSFFTGRVADEDMVMSGYNIPKGTYIFHGIGFLFQSQKYFDHPDKYDPDRFSPQNNRKRNAYAFKPFGFAGKRQCPGQTYALTKMTILLSEWFRHFRFSLAPQEPIKIVWGFLQQPEKEIWINLEKRNK